jgi:hypothetical protein
MIRKIGFKYILIMVFVLSLLLYSFKTVNIQPIDDSSPYRVEVHHNSFYSNLGLSSSDSLTITKNVINSWLNLTPAIPKIEYYLEPYSNEDLELYAVSGCLNNDCYENSGYLAQAVFYPSSDHCKIELFSGSCYGRWSTNGSTECDIQAILTHEFGHCLGLGDNPDNGESVMQDSEASYMRMRFPRVDDQNGVWYTQGKGRLPLYWRPNESSSWSYIGYTQGSPSISENQYFQTVMAYLQWRIGEPSRVAYKALNSSGVWENSGNPCYFYFNGEYQYSYDGVSVA